MGRFRRRGWWSVGQGERLGYGGRNINDVARLLLGTGEVKRNAEASVTEFRAATARLEALLDELAGYLPGVDLKHVDW